MNTAITSIPLPPASVGSPLRRAVTAFTGLTARIRAGRPPLTREELVELVEMRRMAERLREERARESARMGRILA